MLQVIDSNEDELCNATSHAFHGSSVQMKDVMNKKNCGCYLKDSSRQWIKNMHFQIFAFWLNARETKAWTGRNILLVHHVVHDISHSTECHFYQVLVMLVDTHSASQLYQLIFAVSQATNFVNNGQFFTGPINQGIRRDDCT